MSTPTTATFDDDLEADPSCFVNITPPDLPTGPAEAWSLASFGGQLFLGWLSLEADKKRDIRRIHRYSPKTGNWETIHQKTINFGRAMRRQNPDISVTFVTAQDTLLVRFLSPQGQEILQSRDGNTFDLLGPKSTETVSAFNFSHFVTRNDSHHAILTEENRATLSLRTSDGAKWEDVTTPLPHPSALCLFQDHLLLAGNDAARGFDLLMDDDAGWKPVISRGGYRFTLSSEVHAMTVWNDALYFACGRQSQKPDWLQQGFEILRVYPDWSWDLLIGAPRITNAGLKMPLSGFGPGMDEFDPANFCFLQPAGSELLLGTYDTVGGLQIWATKDGETWHALPDAGLIGSNKFHSASALPLGDSVVLSLDVENLSQERATSIWMRSHTV